MDQQISALIQDVATALREDADVECSGTDRDGTSYLITVDSNEEQGPGAYDVKAREIVHEWRAEEYVATFVSALDTARFIVLRWKITSIQITRKPIKERLTPVQWLHRFPDAAE